MAALPFDPIEEACRQWTVHWGEDATPAMGAVTSLMRVQQILLARLNGMLEPFGLTFARYEALMILFDSRRGALPLGKMGRPASGLPDGDHEHRRPARARRPGGEGRARARPPHDAGRDHARGAQGRQAGDEGAQPGAVRDGAAARRRTERALRAAARRAHPRRRLRRGIAQSAEPGVDFRGTIRRIVDERVAPRAAAIDAKGEYPWDIRTLFAEHDLLALPFPESDGGTGTGTLMLKHRGRGGRAACASSALFLMLQELGTLPIQLFGSDGLKQRFLSAVCEQGVVAGVRAV